MAQRVLSFTHHDVYATTNVYRRTTIETIIFLWRLRALHRNGAVCQRSRDSTISTRLVLDVCDGGNERYEEKRRRIKMELTLMSNSILSPRLGWDTLDGTHTCSCSTHRQPCAPSPTPPWTHIYTCNKFVWWPKHLTDSDPVDWCSNTHNGDVTVVKSYWQKTRSFVLMAIVILQFTACVS